MNWDQIYSSERTGGSPMAGPRTDYQRDFDRLIFSSGFRRLQNKTQVFPLPGSTFVHNRLTHSLEVASVGRSIGKIVGFGLSEKEKFSGDQEIFYKYDLPSVIAAACLAHDIGNPAFGHSGEKAISSYFEDNADFKIDGKNLQDFFFAAQWEDFINFEGNANAIRILTHHFQGKAIGGMGLTYSTIASIIKYPCESISVNKNFKHRKKYGFFQTEKVFIEKIFTSLQVTRESADPIIFKRHPYVYMTEAADDICYRIIDMEDAHRLGIISFEDVEQHFLNLLQEIDRKEDKMESIKSTLNSVQDKNEKIAYLRSKCINTLALEAADIFIKNSAKIIAGEYESTLLDDIEDKSPGLKKIVERSIKDIYNHETVVQIEIAGYHVMSDLLKLMVPAVLKLKPGHKDQKVIGLIPGQFATERKDAYQKVMSVLDYVSGMTDPFATELYRKIYGIDIPKHR